MRFDELLEKKGVSSQKIGTYYTLCSALCYTVSLSVLRIMTNYPEVSSDWSIAVKEAVCCLLVLPFIAVRAFRGQYKFPAFGIFLALVLAGFLCEILGARPHLAAYAFLGLALVAPRLLYVSSATEDAWAGQRGEFCSAALASPVWELYGQKGLETRGRGFPRAGDAYQDGCISYHVRAGKHNLTPEDWTRYMDFADRVMGKKK